MSAEIVNLRLARKRKAREEKAQHGDENAARHGQSAAMRTLRGTEEARSKRVLDGKRLDGDGTDADAPNSR